MKGIATLGLLFFAGFSYSLEEHDYPANYQNLDEWKNFLENVARLGAQSEEYTCDCTGVEPALCRLNYESEFPFNCPATPPRKDPPRSVHELTAADISVVGAMGDSITAAFGEESCTLGTIGIEYRGRSWSIGGDDDIDTILTLANIIKFYNPDLKGYSMGTGGPNNPLAKFNVAVSGARAEHMPRQAQELIDRIREDPEVDFENDWKVVSMFIGGNDICQHCFNEDKYSAPQYAEFQRQALDILHENLPRTFVNVIGLISIPELGYLSSIKCDGVHLLVCSCAVFQDGDGHIHVWELTRRYQELTEELITSGRYDTRDDFTVVYQPFLEESKMPFLDNGEADSSYFAPDCFHFSSRGHAVGAKDLWNNMLQPVGKKNVSMDFVSGISCPSDEFPYFYTYLNSPQSPVDDDESDSVMKTASLLIMLVALMVNLISY